MTNDKIGADDFLASGGTIQELLQAAVPYTGLDTQSSSLSGGAADSSDDVFRRTHRGSAQRLVDRWGRERFLWCPITGWYAYDTTKGIWVEDSWWRVHHAASVELPELIANEVEALRAAGLGDEELKRHIKYQHEVEFNGHLEGTIKLLQGALHTSWEDFDTDANKMTVKNGTLHFNGTEVTLRSHSAADMITRAAPVDYVPTARAPFWLESMKRFLPDQEQREYVQRLAGAVLVRGGLKEQILPILSGTGANGKSTFAHGIKSALGATLALEVDPSTLRPDKRSGAAPSPDKVRLRGARFVFAAEAAGQLDAEFLKRITGGEEIVARQLHGRTFAFKPAFTLMLLVNEPPEFQDTTEGLWRRVQVIPFSVRIPDAERIDALTVNQLIEDQSVGILTWMVEGYKEYAARGLSAPESVRLATSSMRGKQDPIGQFLAEYVTIAEGQVLQPKDLYQEWLDFTEDDQDIRSTIGGRSKFTAAVDKVFGDRGQARVNGTPTRGWVGRASVAQLRSRVAVNDDLEKDKPAGQPIQKQQRSTVAQFSDDLSLVTGKPHSKELHSSDDQNSATLLHHEEMPDSVWFDLFWKDKE